MFIFVGRDRFGCKLYLRGNVVASVRCYWRKVALLVGLAGCFCVQAALGQDPTPTPSPEPSPAPEFNFEGAFADLLASQRYTNMLLMMLVGTAFAGIATRELRP